MCWGGNNNGQLGNGSTVSSLVPVKVQGLGHATTAIVTGGQITCAIQSSGSLYCWGDNRYGQLGNGTFTSSSSPVLVSGLSNVVSVSIGDPNVCAALQDGSVKCWGDNIYFVLDRTVATISNVPLPVVGLSDVKTVEVGSGQACALGNGGTIKCWGNFSGLTSGGSALDKLTPIVVPEVSNATSVSVGLYHACALLASGGVKCWGSNDHGQLGQDNTLPGAPQSSQIPIEVAGLQAVELRAAVLSSCARLSSGEVRCWGYNIDGALGNPTPNTYAIRSVVGVSTAIGITSKLGHVCALLQNKSIACWGWNNAGQLGDPSLPTGGSTAGIAFSPTPVTVVGIGPTVDADNVFSWAERTNAEYFSPSGQSSVSRYGYRFRAYNNGHYLGVNEDGEPHLFYVGPLSNNAALDLNLLTFWSAVAEQ